MDTKMIHVEWVLWLLLLKFVNGIATITAVQVTVEEGDTAVLPCTHNDPNIQVGWIGPNQNMLSVNDRVMTNDMRISVERVLQNEWNLHIRNVVVGDGGPYMCMFNTVPVSQTVVLLNVQQRPVSTVARSTSTPMPEMSKPTDSNVIHVSVPAGNTAVLPCRMDIKGGKYTKVVWTMDTLNRLISINDQTVIANPRFSISNNIPHHWNLSIADVKAGDSGNYTCQMDTIPVTRILVTLEVNESVTTKKEPRVTVGEVFNVTVTEGDVAVLPCTNTTTAPNIKAIAVGKKTKDLSLKFNIGNAIVPCDDDVKLLGVDIDFMLKKSWNAAKYFIKTKYVNTAEIPSVRTSRYGRKSFRYEAAQVWNSLPNNLRGIGNFMEFRRLIRTWTGPSCTCSMCS